MKEKPIQLKFPFFNENIQETTMRKAHRGGSMNPIVFHDYESYVAKFKQTEKTTDDTYTPRDVYEAVLKYVDEIYPLEGKEILRPFYPGGDYENAEYPADGVVIDNPPFSMFTKICRFYSENGIPFFLFGPGLTIFSCLKYCSAVMVSSNIRFENGAIIKCDFATNLIGDILVTTSVMLGKMIGACKSQNVRSNRPKYIYPDEVLSVSDFHTISKGEEDFFIKRNEARVISRLDLDTNRRHLYGDHLLVSKAASVKAASVKDAAVKAASVKAADVKAIPITLSSREQRIVDEISAICCAKENYMQLLS